MELGVHRAIEGGALPPYVRRQHDDLLDAVLNPELATNRLVVLRGGSSTGKSRTAYEAVMARWKRSPLFYPRTAAELARLLRERSMRSAVLWLNELRHYADEPGRSEVLFELAELLTGRDRILAITAVWPNFWAKYRANPPGEPGSPDPYRAVRELLSPLADLASTDPQNVDAGRGWVIDVPNHFTANDLDYARRLDDTVLHNAIAAAVNADPPGQVTQYLAGVPDLLNHYQGPGADPYGQALITAAMDAIRLGHDQPCQPELLQEAAIGYLGSRRRTVPAAQWQQDALAYAIQPLKGAVQALEPVPPECGTGVVSYVLADYLDQHGRKTRRTADVPMALWQALLDHGDPREYLSLAAAAQARGLLRLSFRFSSAAAAAGEEAGLSMTARLLRDSDRIDEAITWYRRAAEAGVEDALYSLAEALRSASRADEALLYYQRAAKGGNKQAMSHMADLLRREGNLDGAMVWERRAANAGNPDAALRVAERLVKVGSLDEAIVYYRRVAGNGSLSAARELVVLLTEVGRAEEAAEVEQDADTREYYADLDEIRAIEDEDRRDLQWLSEEAEGLADAGAIESALFYYEKCADAAGDDITPYAGWYAFGAMRDAVRLLHRTRGLEAALSWLWNRAKAADDRALDEAVNLLREAGRASESDQLRRFGWELDGSISPPWRSLPALPRSG
ncbi:hypothetical protein [Streptomyces sp. NPDC096132]|uniref:hypothetical protein n=1 Tax=Streptomyces sp. NPDC096132 TaxID=3366075 RepID=UPI003821EA72